MNLSNIEVNNFYKKIHSKNDREFFKRVWQSSQKIYEDRLNAINFKKFNLVLDAGSGFGQWSVALSSMNKEVIGIDKSLTRVNISGQICNLKKIKNISFKKASVEKIPYKNNTFDSLFSYGVIFSTDWKKTLKEFSRVVKPGGVIYLTANEIGWYLNLWINRPNETTDYNPRKIVIETLRNTMNYEMNKKINYNANTNIIITLNELKIQAHKLNMQVVKSGSEGNIKLNKDFPQSKSFFNSKYDNYAGCYEVLLKKLK